VQAPEISTKRATLKRRERLGAATGLGRGSVVLAQPQFVICEEVLDNLSRNHADEEDGNHRWTQINADGLGKIQFRFDEN